MIKNKYIKELTLTKLLRKEDKGIEVKRVQEWLNLWRYIDIDWFYRVTMDGDFGPQTESVVKQFQARKRISVDGIVGDQTYSRLTKPMFNAYSRIDNEIDLRNLIVKYAEQHLAAVPREFDSNKGPWVRAYMDGHEGKDWPWCMGFVQTITDQACSTLNKTYTDYMPRTYGCDAVGKYGIENGKLLRNSEIRQNPGLIEHGDVFLNVKKKDVDWVHTGFIVRQEGDWIHTIEGNTNDEGSREGFEVCRRMRNFKTHVIDVFKIVL